MDFIELSIIRCGEMKSFHSIYIYSDCIIYV